MSGTGKGATIGVVADTHLGGGEPLPAELAEGLRGVDVIFHLGDFDSPQIYKAFQKIAPVVGVYGNTDPPELRVLLPEKKTLEIEGWTLGLIHGWGPPAKLEFRVRGKFKDVDLILFGHSHIPLFETIDGVPLFNPGSPTRNAKGAGTFGVLELGKTIEHRWIELIP